MNNVRGGFVVVGMFLAVFSIAAWINNINFLADSWDKEGLQIREVASIVGVFFAPVGVINGAVYFFEDEVKY